MKIPKIIFQDKSILVINKPWGLVVNRAESVKGKTLQDWVEKEIKILEIKKLSEINRNFYNRSGIVHRLDKDTSGVMVIAKTPFSFTYLLAQFKQRKVIKRYLALVHGLVEPKIGDIKMPLARQLKDRKKFDVRLGGRKSATNYKVIDYFKQERLSLLEVEPKTGRTHQIRVHLKHIGYPIVSDPIYLGKNRFDKDRKWCPRLFLHAWTLSFIHPESSKRVEFRVKIEKELDKVIQIIQNETRSCFFKYKR